MLEETDDKIIWEMIDYAEKNPVVWANYHPPKDTKDIEIIKELMLPYRKLIKAGQYFINVQYTIDIIERMKQRHLSLSPQNATLIPETIITLIKRKFFDNFADIEERKSILYPGTVRQFTQRIIEN